MKVALVAPPSPCMPSRALVGRWVQEAAAQAGCLLVILDLACQARVRVRCLDAIVLHRTPVLMAIEPHSMAWMVGQRGPDRRGERWREVILHWPGLELVIADEGRAVTWAPFARTHGIARRRQPEGLQGLGVFFPLDHIDGLTALDRCEHLGEVVEDRFHAFQVPQPRSRGHRVGRRCRKAFGVRRTV